MRKTYWMIVHEHSKEPVIEKVSRLWMYDITTLFLKEADAVSYAKLYFNSDDGWFVCEVIINEKR